MGRILNSLCVSLLFPQDKPEEGIEKPKKKLRAVLQLQTIK